MMSDYFITRNGRHVPAQATDQPGTEMLVRTVSLNVDGTPRDRPTLCVSPALTAGDPHQAQIMADELDRRGYLPPRTPMTRAEHARLMSEHRIPSQLAEVLWDVLGRGIPIVSAASRVFRDRTSRQRKNIRTRIQRLIREIGWGETADDERRFPPT